MRKEMVYALIGAAAFVVLMGVFKAVQISAAIAQSASFRLPPDSVTTIQATVESWQSSLELIGELEATEGVVLSAEEAAKVVRVNFENGQSVSSGDLLVELDSSVEQAQLERAVAQRKLAALTLTRQRTLQEKKHSSQAEFDIAQSELDQAVAEVAEFEARINRRKVVAPFSGLTGIREVNVGQFVKVGDPMVPLYSLDKLYLTWSVPQAQAPKVTLGQEVNFTVDGFDDQPFKAKVTAINPQIESNTRNFKVQAIFENEGLKLRPGMFAKVKLAVSEAKELLTIPGSAISYAPYGDSIFVVESSREQDGARFGTVSQHFVKVIDKRGDQVGVVGKVQPGAEIVSSGVFKLRPGGGIRINNSVTPGNEAQPTVSDS